MMSIKNILTGTVAMAGVTASLVIQRQAQVRFGENDAVVRPQRQQLAELAGECELLSNRVAQANNSPADLRITELLKLRIEAEALRKQTDELGKQSAENRRSLEWQMRKSYQEERNREAEHTRRYRSFPDTKAHDAMTLTVALGQYASQHQGEFPSNWEIIERIDQCSAVSSGHNSRARGPADARRETGAALRFRQCQRWLARHGRVR